MVTTHEEESDAARLGLLVTYESLAEHTRLLYHSLLAQTMMGAGPETVERQVWCSMDGISHDSA